MVRTAVVAIVVLTVASCAAGETTTPGLEDNPAVGRSSIATTDVPVAELEVSTVIEPTTTASPPPEPAVTAAPPPTEALAELIPAACDSFRNDGYETRKLTADAMNASTLDGVGTTCTEAFARLTEARTIENRMTALNSGGDGLSATNLVCNDGEFSLDVNNNVDHPIGVHAALQLQAEGDPSPIGSTLEPLVIWSIDAGSTETLTGQYRLTRGSESALTCQVDLTAFDATPGAADASLGGEPRQPELAGDNPALWLPALVAQGAAIPGSNLADAAAAVEDVRSSAYVEVLASVSAEIEGPPASVTISVCSASIDQPDDRTISLVYFAQPTDPATDIDSVLQHALFRRGNDGQWRWLTNSKYFDSRSYWDCGTPSVNR